ncbi:hypothetical protein CR513_31370, partial [Mucuna pruriens]
MKDKLSTSLLSTKDKKNINYISKGENCVDFPHASWTNEYKMRSNKATYNSLNFTIYEIELREDKGQRNDKSIALKVQKASKGSSSKAFKAKKCPTLEKEKKKPFFNKKKKERSCGKIGIS